MAGEPQVGVAVHSREAEAGEDLVEDLAETEDEEGLEVDPEVLLPEVDPVASAVHPEDLEGAEVVDGVGVVVVSEVHKTYVCLYSSVKCVFELRTSATELLIQPLRVR